MTSTETKNHRIMDTANFSIYTPIHSKYVPSPTRLNDILREEIGEGEFEIEMRHNIYNVKSREKLNTLTIAKIRKLSNSGRESTTESPVRRELPFVPPPIST
ncbi:hypothetical protein F4818DRAFT_419466 [Hypoxylon cercidicola]|nr:hypothetical protein F4818DRAFT_419466 [Hypoxylon cercidicola]